MPINNLGEVLMKRVLPIFFMLAMLMLPLTASASILCVPGSVAEIVGDDMIITHPNIDGGAQVYAGTFHVTIDCATPTLVYCTGATVNLCYPGQYVQSPDITSQQVIWILNNYYPAVPGMPSELSTDVQRKAAVQLALWHFTDGIDISTGGSDPVVFAAANAIIVGAQTAAVPPTPTSLVLTPPYSVPPTPGSQVTVTATVLDQNSNPMPNVTINWIITNANPPSGSGVTDANGQFSVSWTAGACNQLTYTVNYTIPIGLRWTYPGCQELIQGATASGRVSAYWGIDCPVSTTPATWGNIKSMYR
jgi:TQXA domain-containing protein